MFIKKKAKKQEPRFVQRHASADAIGLDDRPAKPHLQQPGHDGLARQRASANADDAEFPHLLTSATLARPLWDETATKTKRQRRPNDRHVVTAV